MEEYGADFYEGRDKHSRYAAETILTIIEQVIPEINSAIDFGCGVGTWLNVLNEKGVKDIQGIDGPWVDKNYLVIPTESFLHHDLQKNLSLNKKFDLVISLEVAEHLPQECAKTFISQLTSYGDYVLFSAAIPGQGGINHVNEQLHDYWVKIFEEFGYVCFDFIRRKIWNNKKIRLHYRQNVLSFIKKECVSNLKFTDEINVSSAISIIHPEVYLNKASDPSVITSLKLLLLAIKKSIKRRLSISN